jgi:hypothetical protein
MNKTLLGFVIITISSSLYGQLPFDEERKAILASPKPTPLQIPERASHTITILSEQKKKRVQKKPQTVEAEVANKPSTESGDGCGTCMCSLCSILAMFLCCAYCPR